MRRLFAIFLFAILFGNYAFSYDFSAVCSTGQTLFYNITSDTVPYTVEVTSENTSSPYYTTSPSGDLEIPESVEYENITYSVTSIGEWAFYFCSGMTSVTIGNSIISIGEYAFYGCDLLQSVTITNSVTISNRAFFWCESLTSITIGDSVIDITIGEEAFDRTPWYENQPEGILYMDGWCLGYKGDKPTGALEITDEVRGIAGKAFESCDNITSVTIGNSVKSIGNDAFYGCSELAIVNFNAVNCSTMGSSSNPVFNGCSSLVTLNIGDGVTNIPAYAFKNCGGLTEVTIPNSVESIGSYAFAGCNALAAVHYVGNIGQWCEITFDDQPISYAHNLYINNSLVTDLVIPSDVSEIKPNAFIHATCLTSVTIPNSVTSIGSSAFLNCTSLTGELNIPNSVTSIGSSAFRGCYGLTSLSLGNSVETIGNAAFAQCRGLTGELVIPNSVVSIGSGGDAYGVFWQCSGLTSVTIPNSVTSIGAAAFSGCSGLTEIIIPETVTIIYSGAFINCSGLTSVTIGNSVTTIYSAAFNGCSGLTTLTIPKSVASIDYGVFCDCIALTTVNFNAINCTTMGVMLVNNSNIRPVFSGCSALKTLNIGDSVTNIPDYAFKNCTTLNTINYNAINCTSFGEDNGITGNTNISTLTIGESVETIPDSAFNGCTGLSEIYAYANTPPVLGSLVFNSEIYPTATVYSSCGLVEDYRNADKWNQFANIQGNPLTVFSITAQSQNEDMGSVTGSGNYLCEAEASLMAMPAEGYQFDKWNDGNTENPRTITVNGNETYIASFVKVYTITVNTEHDIITEASLVYDEKTFIPDGNNCSVQCYTSDVTFDNFDADAIITDVDAIKYIRLNAEHSLIGDLQIKITCPSGSSAIILQDYYSSEQSNDLYNADAIDPYTYLWPDIETTTRWRVGISENNWYAGDYMLGRTEEYVAQNEAYILNGKTYFLMSFETESDAWDFVNSYLEIYYLKSRLKPCTFSAGGFQLLKKY